MSKNPHRSEENSYILSYWQVGNIKRSNELLDFHKENSNCNPNKMNPGTTVQDLLEELVKYIK